MVSPFFWYLPFCIILQEKERGSDPEKCNLHPPPFRGSRPATPSTAQRITASTVSGAWLLASLEPVIRRRTGGSRGVLFCGVCFVQTSGGAAFVVAGF